MSKYPYHIFKTETSQTFYEGRFWNAQGKQIAIVAVVTENVDWAAYIGTDAPNSWKEEDTCKWAAQYGCKLIEKDAKYFFPEIALSYRH